MTTIHIPPAALEAGARAMALQRLDEDLWDTHLDAQMKNFYRADARATFVAMVEAWPGMHKEDESAPWVPRLILPLPQEKRNDE